MLQLGGGILPLRCTFYPVALKLLSIVANGFVTFPEYMWAKNAEKQFQISPLVFPIWQLENGHPTKELANTILRCYLVSKAHTNKIPTVVPMFSGMMFKWQ